jgi:hypothetical protein
MDILLFILFCILNSKLAKKKGLKPTPWVFRTIGAMLGGIVVGSFIVPIGYKGTMDVASMQRFLFNNPLKLITLYALEVSGGLLIRYILEQKPDITSQG